MILSAPVCADLSALRPSSTASDAIRLLVLAWLAPGLQITALLLGKELSYGFCSITFGAGFVVAHPTISALNSSLISRTESSWLAHATGLARISLLLNT